MLQFKNLFDLLVALPNEQECIKYLEKYRWNNKVVSPFDPASKVYKCKNNRYKCKNTGKYFNAKTKTIFENSKIPLQKWFWTLFAFSSNKKGISSYQLARDIDVAQKTAWFVLHRSRYIFKNPNFVKDMLKGFVEVDETFIGGKNKNRHWDKKAPNSQGRSWKDKTPVLGIIERGGDLIVQVVPNNRLKTLEPIIETNVKQGSTIYTDEWYRHGNLYQSFNHQLVNHSIKQYVNGKATTNSIENRWSHLKRMIYGTYIHISREHLPKYVNEFAFRNNTRDYGEKDRFNLMLLSTIGKRLTYQQLIS